MLILLDGNYTYIILLLEGRKHDAGMLTDSQLLRDLGQYAFSPTGVPLCVYGDPAYPLRIHLQGPFKHGILTPNMELYNTNMSAVRSSVEWLFGDVINSFKFNDFKKKSQNFPKQCRQDVCSCSHTSKCNHMLIWQQDIRIL